MVRLSHSSSFICVGVQKNLPEEDKVWQKDKTKQTNAKLDQIQD